MKIGEKIKRLRVYNNMTQEELAARSELSKGFISQVERDLTSISIATLVDVLECLGSNLRDFFSEQEEEKIVFGKNDFFLKEDKKLLHKIEWIIPNCQKNSMEPILLALGPGGQSPLEYPHAGEEFGYCLSGGFTLHLGQRRLKVKKGESFYFIPSEQHFLRNSGKNEAKVLWVATPPTF